MQKLEQTALFFEHPMSERVRTYLRIESLFARFSRTQNSEDPDLHHIALATLFEIMDCAARAELKLDLLKDLDRQKKRLKDNPDFQREIPNVVHNLQVVVDDLHSIQKKFGQHLRENEWLMSVRQRMTMSGGTSAVDLPTYGFWQKLPAIDRQNHLKSWSGALMPTGRAVNVLMQLLRHRASEQQHIAESGNYRQSGMGQNIHLLRIKVDQEKNVLPEVSANKYMTHIRFVEVDFQQARGRQVERDVPFTLAACSFEDMQS